MKHARHVAINGHLIWPSDLAGMLGDLRYDALVGYLITLSEKLRRDSDADMARGRQQLAKCLYDAALRVEHAAADIASAWKICEPFMTKKET